MAKEYNFKFCPKINDVLLTGDIFDVVDGDYGTLEIGCPVRFDEYGFHVVWEPKGKDAGVLDIVQIWEARYSGTVKDKTIVMDLEQRSNVDSVELRTIWITYGIDLVQVNSLFLIAKTAQIAKEWRDAINSLVHNYKLRHSCPMTGLQKHWRYLCLATNDRGKIPLRNIIKTFSSGKPEKMVHKCLTDLGLAGDKEREELDVSLFTFEKFLRLYHKICPRTEVQELFVKLSGQKEYLTKDRLIHFLNEEQRDPRLNEILFPFFDNERVRQLIAKYETDESYIAQGKMSGDGFLRFLMSDENSPVFLDRTELNQDMDQPLCHYYINSSHNTYLTGRQYGGKSSTEIYRQVLLSGCRCVELDAWDRENEPIITHGKAMCTDVNFKDVLYQIKDTAFMRTDFPVILSFENHCSKSNQLKMAKYCMEVFGDMLLAKPLDDFPLEPGVPLPSPNRLKRKILIKNKRLKPEVERHQLEQFLREGRLDEDDDLLETPEVVGEDMVSSPGDQRAHPEMDNPSQTPPPIGPEIRELDAELKTNFISKLKPLSFAKKPAPILTKEEEERIFAEYSYTGATTNIHPLLSSLVNYTHPVKFAGFDVAEQNNYHFHMSSFSESTGLGYLKQSAPEFVNYNKRQLSRIYPKGARVDSSNFLPQIFWNAGCQMVSLNFQTPDVCMQLNQGKFDYNGNCGYLLKPDFMRRPDRTFDPFSESPVDGVIAAHCSVRVISGQFLCERKVGTYVEVEMYGLPTDTIRKEHRTKTVPANGLNPVYQDEPFVFRKVVLPELAVLRFAVYDENNKQLGQRILPLDGLQAGYRHISLRTESTMSMCLPTLFVHLVLKTYVPDELSGLVDALADPRAYLQMSAQEKRKEALHNMGVDDSDIVEVPAGTGNGTTGENIGPAIGAKKKDDNKLKANGAIMERQNAVQTPTQESKEGTQVLATKNVGDSFENKFKFDPIVTTTLRKEKIFQKLAKKMKKDMEEMQKRHQKQRDAIQKQQQTSVDKLMGDSKKTKKNLTSTGSGSSRHSSLSGRMSDPIGSDVCSDYKIRSLVSNQTDEWSTMVRKQVQELFELRKQQIIDEYDLLKKLLTDAQKQQMDTLKTKLDVENRDLKQSQTRKSMEDTKQIEKDTQISSRAEKERRVKETKERNLKQFVEERKRLAMKAEMHEKQLNDLHAKQLDNLEREKAKALEQEEMNHQESLLASKPENIQIYSFLSLKKRFFVFGKFAPLEKRVELFHTYPFPSKNIPILCHFNVLI
uniref:1-phosphatidylinositol 4,5-bisphosphate phosphodiesterase n=1 Tax=Panagrolaimus sp. JU765 TaxID=591449 RepID=A0AC34RK70_9BILA